MKKDGLRRDFRKAVDSRNSELTWKTTGRWPDTLERSMTRMRILFLIGSSCGESNRLSFGRLSSQCSQLIDRNSRCSFASCDAYPWMIERVVQLLCHNRGHIKLHI